MGDPILRSHPYFSLCSPIPWGGTNTEWRNEFMEQCYCWRQHPQSSVGCFATCHILWAETGSCQWGWGRASQWAHSCCNITGRWEGLNDVIYQDWLKISVSNRFVFCVAIAPSGPPIDVFVEATSPESLLVKWKVRTVTCSANYIDTPVEEVPICGFQLFICFEDSTYDDIHTIVTWLL